MVVIDSAATKLSGGELVQSQPKNVDNTGAVSWTFNWTAPSTPTDSNETMYASGLSANGDGGIGGDASASVTLAVTVTGSSPGGLPLLTATPALSFAYAVGGGVPASLVPGATWLTATPVTGTTPGTIKVTMNPAGLSAGTYTTNVTVTSAGAANTLLIPVTLLVLTPSNLSFTYSIGDVSPPSAQSVLMSSDGTAGNYSATSAAAWLTAGPATGAMPTPLALSVSPAGLAPGTYTSNITITVPVTLMVKAPDLIESNVTIAGPAVSGGTVPVTDTVINQGTGNAAITSMTWFYLSSDGVTKGTYLGFHTVPPLLTGSSYGPSNTTLSLPSNLVGTYYIIACADGPNQLVETNENNNCSPSGPMPIAVPDLLETAVSILTPSPVGSGSSMQVSETVLNQGGGGAGASVTAIYLSSDGVTKGTRLATRNVPALAAGAGSGPVTTTMTLPTNVAGLYYVIACADSTSVVAEGNENNNCTTSSNSVQISGPDLVETSMTILTASPVAAGATIQVQDTAKNLGPGSAAASMTWFYLSSDGVTKGTYLYFRSVSALAGGASSGPATTSFALPSPLSVGSYFILACADGPGQITESNESNNCTASPVAITVTAGDLVTVGVSSRPAAAVPGSTIAASDTTMNNGLVNTTGSSYTRYYLSKTSNLIRSGSGAGVLLGSRTVSVLASGGSSAGGINATIPSNTTAGAYYLIACADDTNLVAETNENNNCTPSALVVYTAANTIFVDQNNPNSLDSNCGAQATPCKTIGEGLAAAASGQTVLVNDGAYTEQVSIVQNIALSSINPLGAVIQAPAVLQPDAAKGYTAVVNINGGATSVLFTHFGVAGPGPSSCNSLSYGVFVGNANAIVTGNQVSAIRDSSFGNCASGTAIAYGSRAYGYVAHTGTISYNITRDYQLGGIAVDGDGTNVSVVGNSVIGQNAPGILGQAGITVSRAATGLVDSNTVLANRYGNTPLTMGATGIKLYDLTGSVTVTNNTVTGNDEGIGVYTDSAPSVATNLAIKNNVANTNAVIGIHVDAASTGNTVWLNTIQNSGVYEEADEHIDWTFNNWGTGANSNILGPAPIHVGPFTF